MVEGPKRTIQKNQSVVTLQGYLNGILNGTKGALAICLKWSSKRALEKQTVCYLNES